MTAPTTSIPTKAECEASRAARATHSDRSPRRTTGLLTRPGTGLRGYHQASGVERGAFGMLASFGLTIGIARAINYVRERRRHAPRLRSWARHAYHAPGRERLRVHHFIPGIALMLLSGGGAILSRDDGREFWFSVPFGTGAGLIFDEIAVLTELDNPYWESERLAAAQAGVAGVGALALLARFHLLGARA